MEELSDDPPPDFGHKNSTGMNCEGIKGAATNSASGGKAVESFPFGTLYSGLGTIRDCNGYKATVMLYSDEGASLATDTMDRSSAK